MTQEVYDILSLPKRIRAEIQRTETELEGLRMSMLPGSVRYDKDIVQTSPQDPMAQYIVRVERLLTKITRLKRSYLAAQDQVMDLCNQLSSPQSEIISMRFVSSYSFEVIAGKVCLSERQMFRYYRKGLNEIDDILKKKKDVSECQ